jgi:tetratricopeptide (TPR) repeat protein
MRGLGAGVIAAVLAARAGTAQGQYSRDQAQQLINTKDWNRVLAYGQAWTRAEPQNSDAWFLVGRAYGSKYYHIGLERPADAAPAFERAAALKPEWPDGWNALAVIQQELGQWDRSAVSLERAVRLAPERTKYWDFLCASYIHLHRWDQATRATESLARQAHTSADWFMVGADYYAIAPYYEPTPSYQQSKAAFTRVVQLDPRNGPAWTNLGTTEQALGNRQAAFEDYAKGARFNDPGGARNYDALQKDIQACMILRQNFAQRTEASGMELVSYNRQCGAITGEITLITTPY